MASELPPRPARGPSRIIRFVNADGLRTTIQREQIEGLVEIGEGLCQVVTASDSYAVKVEFLDAENRIWGGETPV